MPDKSPKRQWTDALFASLEPHGFHVNASGTSTEVYFSGFATVQISVGDSQVDMERYYDNELIDQDRHFHRSEPITPDRFPDAAKVERCALMLLASIRSEEPILNFGED